MCIRDSGNALDHGLGVSHPRKEQIEGSFAHFVARLLDGGNGGGAHVGQESAVEAQMCIRDRPGDVPVTYADTGALERDFGYKPGTDLRTGLRRFAQWYAEFYPRKE